MHPEAINGGPGNRVTQIPPGALGSSGLDSNRNSREARVGGEDTGAVEWDVRTQGLSLDPPRQKSCPCKDASKGI